MERYIGPDVHAASCTLAVIAEEGRISRVLAGCPGRGRAPEVAATALRGWRQHREADDAMASSRLLVQLKSTVLCARP